MPKKPKLMTQKKVAKLPGFVEVLVKDHRKVKGLFEKFEKTKNESKKEEIVRTILNELSVHAKAEEEVVYSAFREKFKDEKTTDLLDEADTEHHVAKGLIAELETMRPGDDHYDSKVVVLGEIIDHHVEEEETHMLPKASQIKDESITERLVQRKQELMEEMTLEAVEKV